MNKALQTHVRSTIADTIAAAPFRQSPRTYRDLWDAMADYRRVSAAARDAGRSNELPLRYEIVEMAVECAMSLPSFASGMGLSVQQARQALRRLGVKLDGVAMKKSFTSKVAEEPRNMNKENVTMSKTIAKITTRRSVKNNVLAAVELLHERDGAPPSITAVQKLTGHSYATVRKYFEVGTLPPSERAGRESAIVMQEPAVEVGNKTSRPHDETVRPRELHLQLTTSARQTKPMTLKVDLSQVPEDMSAIRISFIPA